MCLYCIVSRHTVVCQWPRNLCGVQLFFYRTANSMFSTPLISITTGPICIKFTCVMPSIYVTLHTKFENISPVVYEMCVHENCPIFFTVFFLFAHAWYYICNTWFFVIIISTCFIKMMIVSND